MKDILRTSYSYLKRKIRPSSIPLFPKSTIFSVFRKSKVVESLDSIRNPPATTQFALKNAYIPLTRRALVRELLQDSSTVLPFERKSFEKIAVFLDRKLESQFQILQSEFSVLSHPLDVSNNSEGTSSSSIDTANNANELDREFWLLRRLADIAPIAGFIEIPQQQLQKACNSIKSKHHGLIAYVDPDDYDVLRFWIRGFHPNFNATPACSTISNLTDSISTHHERKQSTFKKVFIRVSQLFNILERSIKRSYSPNIHGYESVDSFTTKSDLFYFSRVLMCVRRKNSHNLDLKLFENVPVTGIVRNSTFADNLLYLLPNLRTIPLSKSSRSAILLSTTTAVCCLGVISPIAWLFNSNNYDLVLAWSMAATSCAITTLSIVWVRYWRAQTNLANNLKYMQYLCCQSSGLQSINTLLKLAHEQEFKAALLTYALLLRPTDSNTALTPVQLGFRAESWIAKHLSPQSHISLPSSIGAPITGDSLNSRFNGGSGPLFDLSFDANRSLQILRRLDLVRGSESSPNAVSPDTASVDIPNDGLSNSIGLDRLWVTDPLFKESDLNLSKSN
ncbi:hypothetical protein MS3_00008462 [Schistosoma haematobium]|uniref:Transmembrane protein n=2 Tax=Schistosoma haematobium TaxID=6185 RepID=A0A922LEZ1_SCHHA|nr:hypothetical protein MS3_00008462 [Schistosoma haematobium]KAH9581275.1 hypothetical protein MS3_00008462 [Schistosoma haematobium]CAH8623004.1 unnamed protein product [Schistosoma haematobium]CAH8630681.1 unnamed protein product [Schistosoma haematobium]